MNLTDKRVLVTGGTSGIGLAIAESLAAEGCRVAIVGRSATTMEKALKQQSSDAIIGRLCDVSDREQVAALFKWLQTELGPVDILVNSAGINVRHRLMANLTPEDFDRIMAVNTTGTFNCIHQVLPGMRAKKEGLIINIVSVAGKRNLLLAGLPYCVSKFATGALGTFVNLEEAAHGIKVTNIYPGETNTPLVDQRPQPPSPEKARFFRGPSPNVGAETRRRASRRSLASQRPVAFGTLFRFPCGR